MLEKYTKLTYDFKMKKLEDEFASMDFCITCRRIPSKKTINKFSKMANRYGAKFSHSIEKKTIPGFENIVKCLFRFTLLFLKTDYDQKLKDRVHKSVQVLYDECPEFNK